jgi:hypothetical protein
MGLDTSHGCWHGPYSQFMHWREWLNLFVMLDREKESEITQKVRNMGATREALLLAWDEGLYDDQSVPINVLMLHSDYDGEIAAEVCGPLADALQDIADRRMPPRGTYDLMRMPTDRFIAGLRKAAAANEPVSFG